MRDRLGVTAGGTLVIEEIENGIILQSLVHANTLANENSDSEIEG